MGRRSTQAWRACSPWRWSSRPARARALLCRDEGWSGCSDGTRTVRRATISKNARRARCTLDGQLVAVRLTATCGRGSLTPSRGRDRTCEQSSGADPHGSNPARATACSRAAYDVDGATLAVQRRVVEPVVSALLTAECHGPLRSCLVRDPWGRPLSRRGVRPVRQAAALRRHRPPRAGGRSRGR